MPIYKFYCKHCKSVHESLYLWKHNDNTTYLDDPEMEQCPQCSSPVEQLSALAVMRPDTHWNGVYIDTIDKYSTSQSKYKLYLKANSLVEVGDRTDREGLKKWTVEAEKDKDRKAEKVLDSTIRELFKSEEFGLTGTVKERNRKQREIDLMESAHPEDVCVDEAFK